MRKHLFKTLLALALVLISGNAWANEVTFTPADFSGQGTSGTGSAVSATKGGVTISTAKGFGADQFRVYKNADFSITATSTITSLSFTFSGDYTGGLETKYNNLSSKSWTIASMASQARFMEIVVTLDETDDDDDDDGGDTPAALTTIEQIQAACVAAGNTATDATITFNNWVVTGIKGGNNIYVSDGTQGFVIYASNAGGFVVGDILSGTVACQVLCYSGNTYELKGVTSTTTGLTVTKGGTVTPKVMTLADVTLANQGTVVTLKNVEYDGADFTDGTKKVKFYDAFGTKVSLNAGGKYDITGIVIPYSTVEIAPRTADDVKSLSSQVAAESSWAESSVYANLGEAVSNTFTTNSDGAVTYTSSNTSVATVATNGTITLVGEGTTTITAETAETENYFASSVSFTLVVTDPNSTDVTDVITFDWIGETGTSYTSWENKVGASGVTYAGNHYLGVKEYIQLKSKDSVSGIVATSSTGFASKIVINWDSSTDPDRVLDVYGKSTPYESAADLYTSNVTKGTKIGSIKKSEGNELIIEGNYPFIGLRSNSSALYIRSIEITWSKAYSRDVTEGEFGTICLPFDVSFGDTSGAKFYTVAGKTVSAGVPQAIVLDEVDKLAAGVPYIFQATDSKLSCKFTGSAVEEAGNAGGLYGTFADATAVESGKYIIYNNTVKMCGSDCTVDAFRAYIDMDEVEEATGAGAVSIRMNDATGISVLSKEADCKFYDLQGRSVDQPQRGIYVVNGQKVIVK